MYVYKYVCLRDLCVFNILKQYRDVIKCQHISKNIKFFRFEIIKSDFLSEKLKFTINIYKF